MSIVFQDHLCSQSLVFLSSNCQGRKSTNYIELVDLCIHTRTHLELDRLHIERWARYFGRTGCCQNLYISTLRIFGEELLYVDVLV